MTSSRVTDCSVLCSFILRERLALKADPVDAEVHLTFPSDRSFNDDYEQTCCTIFVTIYDPISPGYNTRESRLRTRYERTLGFRLKLLGFRSS